MPEKTKTYTVKCEGLYCGPSANGLLCRSGRPYRSMISADMTVAALRARSLSREFPGRRFEIAELD